MSDFDFEPVPGLPERLPAGERMLWQGAPNWWVLARKAFHVRKVAIYFVLLIAWGVGAAISEGRTDLAVSAFLWLSAFAAAAIGILLLIAWTTARSTVYTITSRRVVMRFGIALPMTVNLPFKVIGAAALRLDTDGTGDIPLKLSSRDRVAWLALWPHARPWRVNSPEPMLRAIGDAQSVGNLLAEVMQAALIASPVGRTAAPEVRPLHPAAAATGHSSDRQLGSSAALAS